MGKYTKIKEKILLGDNDNNIDLTDLCHLLSRLGFNKRIKGDHHIFSHDMIDEIINIQPKGNKAKSYQVKQIRDILLKYKLGESNVD